MKLLKREWMILPMAAVAGLGLTLGGLCLTGCDNDSPTEKRLERAGENIKDAAKDTGEVIKDAAKDTGDAIKDVADKAGDKIEDATN